MPTWIQLADECLAGAKALLDGGCFRSCASRAYFAAYASATHALRASGRAVGRAESDNPSHAQLASLVRNNLDARRFDATARRDLARVIGVLQRFRIVSDYIPAETIDRHRALNCFRDAARVRDQLGGTADGRQ